MIRLLKRLPKPHRETLTPAVWRHSLHPVLQLHCPAPRRDMDAAGVRLSPWGPSVTLGSVCSSGTACAVSLLTFVFSLIATAMNGRSQGEAAEGKARAGAACMKAADKWVAAPRTVGEGPEEGDSRDMSAFHSVHHG